MFVLATELKKGWAFVSGLSEILSKSEQDGSKTFAVPELVEESLKFFGREKEFKEKHSAAFGFGYSAVDHKEGLRVLTGRRLGGMFECANSNNIQTEKIEFALF